LLGNGSTKRSPKVAGQQLGKIATAATNTHATIEELLDASFSVRSVSYQGKQVTSSSQIFLLIYGFFSPPVEFLLLYATSLLTPDLP
jgi:hypothetical protein